LRVRVYATNRYVQDRIAQFMVVKEPSVPLIGGDLLYTEIKHPVG
jgi:hypothetical protein